MRWRTYDLPKIIDGRGNLTFIENHKHVPFAVERIYYIYDVPSGSMRAGHAHRSLRQVFIALAGSFSVHLEGPDCKESIMLNRPDVGLYVPAGVWRVIDNFSAGSVLLVLASELYCESDYIRSYEDFLQHSAAAGLKNAGLK